jgi:hypothetical protein
MTTITADELRRLLNYDPMTGDFTWVQPTSDRTRVGQKAGRVNRGYTSIKIHRREYGAHRLAWLYVHGTWPANDIDHINRDRSDNRIANLREATRAQNLQNIHYKGAYWYKPRGKWRVTIRVEGKRLWVGDFNTPEAALAARQVAAEKYHTHRPT